mgnify:CR=1 FL=1
MTVSIAVTSGKGGVGKTNCAVNLSMSLTKMGKKVVLFDADFGMANAHILLGTNPKHTAAEFLQGTSELENILSEGPSGLQFIAGGSGLLELLNLDNRARYQMLQSLSDLENKIDYLVVDTPAGASESALFFASAVTVPLVVLVAEPTSFLDAYALIKAAHIEKNLQNFSVVVNMANGSAEAKNNFDKFFDICRRFLDVNLHYAGMIPLSNAIRRSIVKRAPIVTGQPSSPETKAFLKLAKEMTNAPINTHDGIRFFHRDVEAAS